MLDKLLLLESKCKALISLEINSHKNYYMKVEDFLLDEFDDKTHLLNEVGTDVFNKMVELDKIVELQFYPNTPIGFYKIYHFDIDMALERALEILESVN